MQTLSVCTWYCLISILQDSEGSYSRFHGSQSISSDDYFGRETKGNIFYSYVKPACSLMTKEIEQTNKPFPVK